MKTQWPWITLLVAAVAIFNPVGWAFVSAAIRYSVTDWLRDLAVVVTLTGAAILIAMGLIEWWLRRRYLARLNAVTTDRRDG
jgi:hypothetical protein